jgi:hypothetical protein
VEPTAPSAPTSSPVVACSLIAETSTTANQTRLTGWAPAARRSEPADGAAAADPRDGQPDEGGPGDPPRPGDDRPAGEPGVQLLVPAGVGARGHGRELAGVVAQGGRHRAEDPRRGADLEDDEGQHQGPHQAARPNRVATSRGCPSRGRSDLRCARRAADRTLRRRVAGGVGLGLAGARLRAHAVRQGLGHPPGHRADAHPSAEHRTTTTTASSGAPPPAPSVGGSATGCSDDSVTCTAGCLVRSGRSRPCPQAIIVAEPCRSSWSRVAIQSHRCGSRNRLRNVQPRSSWRHPGSRQPARRGPRTCRARSW